MNYYASIRDLSLHDLGAEPISAVAGFASQYTPVAHSDTAVTYKLDPNKIEGDLKHIDKDIASPSSKKPASLEQGAGTPRFSPGATRAANGASPWYNKIDATAARMPGVRRIMNHQMRIMMNTPRRHEKLSPRARAHMLRKMKLEQLKKNGPIEKPIGNLPVVAKMMRRAEARGFGILRNIATQAAPAPMPNMLKVSNNAARALGARRQAPQAASYNARSPVRACAPTRAQDKPRPRRLTTLEYA